MPHTLGSSIQEDAGPSFLRIPRWTAAGVARPGFADHRTPLPGDLTSGIGDFAREHGVTTESVLLAVHFKVLSLVTSERHVLTGYVPSGATRAPLPGRMEVVGGSWERLVREAHAIRRRIEENAAEAEETFEAVLDLSGRATAPADGTVLWVGVRDGELILRHRQDAVDADHAGRIAGYYLAALRLLTAAPDAPHHRQSLLSEQELQIQLHGLAGERKALPRQMFVELFEEQVRIRPDALAAAHGASRWTYAELNDRANRIAHALLGRGLRPEDVVAVVTERNLNWAAATLGVFKAGGVYLPVRPEFPAERIGTQLERSVTRFAISEQGSTEMLDEALKGLGHDCPLLFVSDVYEENPGAEDPRVPVQPGQLAYIYFTSGSTGAPKGAMCEHAGMLNHLYAKIEDMELAEGDVVTQTASQCFDISLWQLVAPWLTGGSTRIVDTDVLLDPERFLDEVVTAGVHVAQLVPSYFEVLIAQLEKHPRDLGSLRMISVTGEALKLELVQNWFARGTGVRLVNAYGATEVSDDTMHEVLDGPPPRDFVTVGRSLRNVNTYILDENLSLVPLGSPGEIAFSGVCVGRGYINDEERTRQAFVPDPYRPDTRMYRTGDFGRWLPEGRIEFLGRRDQQVKIRGFRIEIGEIENKLLAMPGVRDAAVVIDDGGERARNLVAFYAGHDALRGEEVRDFLARFLPDYMVPTYFHRLDSLPLTENGKTDKRMLKDLAATLGHAGGTYVAPSTPTERRLAVEWAEVLNVPVERIGRSDDFFELGGTSLAAVRLVVKLDRLLSLAQVVGHSVLADLAAIVDAGGTAAGGGEGERTSLLQRLSGAPGAVATLICFPYAGGNAVNFQLLAKELEREGIAVYGVELPGHDFVGAAEPMADVEEVARRVHQEVRRRVSTPILLWGHCAGAAYAVELARLLERDSAQPLRVFLGAAGLETVEALRAEIEEVTALDNREITVRLLEESVYVELDGLKPERSELVGAAYRHDVQVTNRYFMSVREDPGSYRLRAGLDLVHAADDPSTAGPCRQALDGWADLADRVERHELPEGGHYFTRTRAAETAAVLIAACSDLVKHRSTDQA
ncbi:non-ribosomal peptide synthetase [Streptosporangium carneum]|uniref:Amino acid adenylation protein n=1 Tax=Streptosporangium carneum TaxID=47481 RepID=A0A9W6I610_9ACTN|nr:amino acid adenylation domain-containing protein [Streptosporangium carneum]GLK12333.1 amino acid adenylation protein [Streptosporangium carneum]